jgi:hypothetical protein
MQKPFVHLFGPPLNIALDAQITSCFVCSSCCLNAVLHLMICKTAEEQDPSSSKSHNSDMLTFGVFALHNIKANKEVVLGWEWDDSNTVHHLPALIKAPHMFPYTAHALFFHAV